jgi:hypothetical protein
MLHTREKRGVHTGLLMGNPNKERILGGPEHRWENFKIHHREIG